MGKYYKDGERIQGTDGKSGYDLGDYVVFDGKIYYLLASEEISRLLSGENDQF